jgi:hypothetical protein
MGATLMSDINQAYKTSDFKLISESTDRAQLDFINKAGHCAFQEYPQEVTDLVVKFIGNAKDMTSERSPLY